MTAKDKAKELLRGFKGNDYQFGLDIPVPLTAEQVDEYMAPVLHAAAKGDFSLIRSYFR